MVALFRQQLETTKYRCRPARAADSAVAGDALGQHDELGALVGQGLPSIVECDVPADLNAQLPEVAVEDGELGPRRDPILQVIAADEGDRVRLSIDPGHRPFTIQEDGGVGVDRAGGALLDQIHRDDQVRLVPPRQGPEGFQHRPPRRDGAMDAGPWLSVTQVSGKTARSSPRPG